MSTWRTILTASDNGLLVYGLGGRTTPFRVTWFDRSGQALRVIGEPANHIDVALSPDGARVVIETQYQPNADLWVIDIASGMRRRITTSPRDDSYPVWSPDGARIAFAAKNDADPYYRTEVIRSDGAGAPAILFSDSTADAVPLSWSRDGNHLLVARGSYRGTFEAQLWRLALADGTCEPVLPSSQLIASSAFSPDGRWIAFTTLASGRPEISVIAAPRPGQPPDLMTRQWPVTSSGGEKPVWRSDSRELYYMRPDGTLVALAVDGSGGELRVVSETPLFQAFQREYVHSYDVSPDGQKFVVNVAGSAEGAPLGVVTNWTRTLARK
jgi:Tol biopolymer transport system component